MHGDAQMSQHEMLSSFVFSKSIQGSRNQRLNHTRVTRSMPWVQSRYMDEGTRLHGTLVTDRFCHITDILITLVAMMCC